MSNNKERWVIKAGSSLVTGEQEGINELFIKNLVSQVHELIKNNRSEFESEKFADCS